MKKNYFFILLVTLLIFPVHAQKDNRNILDSLKKLDKLLDEALTQYDYNTTIEYSAQLIDLASQIDNHKYLYLGYRMLGITYQDLEDPERSRENYEKALEYAMKTNNDTLLMGAHNNLGNVFSENPETVELGLEYYDKAISYGNRMNGTPLILTPVLNKGWTHLDNHQYEKAFPYLEKAKELIGEEPSPEVESQLASLYGRYYSGTNELQQAEKLFQKAVEIAERDSLIIAANFAYKEYAGMLFKKGDHERAYRALQKHQEYKDQLLKEEKIHQMEAAYARFGTEESIKKLELAQREQEYQDEVLEKTRQVSIILVISVVIMLLFLILLFRNNRIRKKLIGQLKEKNTELIEAKEKAERLSLLKTRFFSTVSHELRTPLYGVVGLTSLLLEDNKDKKQVEDLKSLKFSADYLLALINDVLQMNKMESKLVHLENIPFDFKDLLQGIIKSFEFSRNQNRNVIELEIDQNIPANLIGDSVRFSQVIMNLVGNAVKFTERGKVWIKADLKGLDEKTCLIRFEIGDTGIGIPKTKQQEVFEEFSQLRSSSNYQGTGLGLPIVKKLLELFGSEIQLQSEEGKGSVFTFNIPFRIGVPAELSGNEGVMGSLQEKEAKTVLIVDDNRINQVVTRRILEKENFTCKVATGGYEALEILKVASVDVVLMDVNMPDISGMEATKLVREFNKDVPIIALTAVEVDEMREEILASGMNDIIVKPYDTAQFFNTVYKNLMAVPAGQ